MRIVFLIPALEAGGAERVATTLSNRWVGAGCAVEILTFQPSGSRPHYALDDRVRLHLRRPVAAMPASGETRALWKRIARMYRRVAAVRKVIREVRPDILLCFMTEMNIVGCLAAARSNVALVISERVHPVHLQSQHQLLQRLVRRIYPRAAALVVQTEDIAGWFRKEMGTSTTVIPNPIELDTFGARAAEDGRRRLVSVGRLHPQKGFDLLIAAFAGLAGEFPEWDLEIFGEGAERAGLEALVARRGLQGRVRLPGVVDDIPARLAATTIYVQPSRYEGFPNALLEALAAGCPVVATDVPGASAELLAHGGYGLLVPPDDTEALGDALRRLMSQRALRDEFAARARTAAVPYGAEAVAGKWLALFDDIRRNSRQCVNAGSRK